MKRDWKHDGSTREKSDVAEILVVIEGEKRSGVLGKLCELHSLPDYIAP